MKRAQAAMEFLMTYGWAILVVLIVISALAYSGVLDPSALLPDKCVFASGVICENFAIESSRITMILQNHLGSKITVDGINVTQTDGQTCAMVGTSELDLDAKGTFIIIGCNNGFDGEKFSGEILFRYTKEGLFLSHDLSGSISAKVTEGSTTASEPICLNAETGGLCDGLDIVFGEGYRSSCCGEFGLCCVP